MSEITHETWSQGSWPDNWPLSAIRLIEAQQQEIQRLKAEAEQTRIDLGRAMGEAGIPVLISTTKNMISMIRGQAS